MKKLMIFLIALLFISCNDSNNVISTNTENADRISKTKALSDTVSVKLTNVTIVGDFLKFDVECKLVSTENFIMGSSTFAFDKVALINPTLSNVNSRYTIGNGNGYYQMMVGDYGSQVVLQIIYLNSPGSSLFDKYERIATVTMKIVGSHQLNFNNNLSFIIKPDLTKAYILF